MDKKKMLISVSAIILIIALDYVVFSFKILIYGY